MLTDKTLTTLLEALADHRSGLVYRARLHMSENNTSVARELEAEIVACDAAEKELIRLQGQALARVPDPTEFRIGGEQVRRYEGRAEGNLVQFGDGDYHGGIYRLTEGSRWWDWGASTWRPEAPTPWGRFSMALRSILSAHKAGESVEGPVETLKALFS